MQTYNFHSNHDNLFDDMYLMAEKSFIKIKFIYN